MDGINVNITNGLACTVGLIAQRHPDYAIQIEWRDGTPQEEWIVTASNGLNDVLYVVYDETGTWAPFTEQDRARYDRGESILGDEIMDHELADSKGRPDVIHPE